MDANKLEDIKEILDDLMEWGGCKKTTIEEIQDAAKALHKTMIKAATEECGVMVDTNQGKMRGLDARGMLILDYTLKVCAEITRHETIKMLTQYKAERLVDSMVAKSDADDFLSAILGAGKG